MPEIPEHLLKRSAERRKQLGLPTGEEGGETPEAAAPEGGDASAETPAQTPAATVGAGDTAAGAGGDSITEDKGGVPAHLLERSRRRKAALSGGGGGEGAAAPAAAAAGGTATATAVKAAPAPTMTGPGGHTQRLLTVVKSGSIQQTRAEAQDKVHTWPHLLVVEFAAILAMTAVVLIFSAIVRAPLLGLADVNQTPNPSKAPWYFLGLQELLTMFHPMVAGVTIPGMGLFLLIVAPYVDKNPSHKPEDRKFVISLFTIFLMFWAVLVIIGSFFRGPGFNFVFPWNDGIFFEL
jgi:quinol---cytochrome c reductase cytochrome c subunit, bacillus type